jgi:hypothetical protein
MGCSSSVSYPKVKVQPCPTPFAIRGDYAEDYYYYLMMMLLHKLLKNM